MSKHPSWPRAEAWAFGVTDHPNLQDQPYSAIEQSMRNTIPTEARGRHHRPTSRFRLLWGDPKHLPAFRIDQCTRWHATHRTERQVTRPPQAFLTALPLQSNVGIALHSCSALKAGFQAASSQTTL